MISHLFATQPSQEHHYEQLPTTSPPSRSSSTFSSPALRASTPPPRGPFLPRRLYRLLAFSLLTIGGIGIVSLTLDTASVPDARARLQAQYEGALDAVKGVYADKGRYIPEAWPKGTCALWDPEGPEADDPVGCERAKLYRQVEKVLERELHKKDRHPFNKKPNIENFSRLLQCYLPDHHPDARECVDRPVIINTYYWGGLSQAGGASGEAVWQGSIIKLFEEQGMHSLFFGPYENWIVAAEMMPDVYRFIWADSYETISCVADPRCIAPEHYVPPNGMPDISGDVPEDEKGVVPLYRLLSVDYWGAAPNGIMHTKGLWGVEHMGEWTWHPMGNGWISTPWPLPGHSHLAYSVEEHCLRQPYVPLSEKTADVLILAKQSDYFYVNRAVPHEQLTQLSEHFPLRTAARERDLDKPIPKGITAIGFQKREAYEALVSHSRVMLGIGFPPISPSVYTALCQGTPVVMPYFAKDRQEEGMNLTMEKDGWDMYSDSRYQHGPAAAIGPPYVYSYYYKNYIQLERAVALAHSTSIDRYIPDDMRISYARQTTRTYLARDFHAEMLAIIEQNGGSIPGIEGYIVERCRERRVCKLDIPAGRKHGQEIPDRKIPKKGEKPDTGPKSEWD